MGLPLVRGAAAEQAMQDFEGPSAQVSWFAHLTQESNRSRPDSALFTLSEMVLVAIVQADAERERLSTLAAWEARQAEREEQRRLDPTGGAASPLASSAFSLFGGLDPETRYRRALLRNGGRRPRRFPVRCRAGDVRLSRVRRTASMRRVICTSRR
ncbi:hypothetical protein C5C00_12680 [Rathayibacter rathayi]|nr:hypothetical protein C5C47_12505 [Rathayibacter rathayi]PPG94111.1 hypothetical protein C5C00_12680 [Rathayibacter rathayi]